MIAHRLLIDLRELKAKTFLSDERQLEVRHFSFHYALTLLNVYLQASLLAYKRQST